jgi:hypothetical protein
VILVLLAEDEEVLCAVRHLELLALDAGECLERRAGARTTA